MNKFGSNHPGPLAAWGMRGHRLGNEEGVWFAARPQIQAQDAEWGAERRMHQDTVTFFQIGFCLRAPPPCSHQPEIAALQRSTARRDAFCAVPGTAAMIFQRSLSDSLPNRRSSTLLNCRFDCRIKHGSSSPAWRRDLMECGAPHLGFPVRA